MSLKQHLSIRSPLLWVITDEPHRVTDEIILHSDRSVYRLDPLQGFLVWVEDQQAWKKVLVVDNDGNPSITFNLQVAMMEALERQGVFVIDYAHFSAEQMVPFYGAISRIFLDAVRKNSAENIPAQFIMLSCKDEVPIELSRETTKITYELPSKEELASITERVSPKVLPEDTTKLVVRAGQGLSELEFISACMQSLQDTGEIDPEQINHAKINTIKSGGLLEIRTPDMGLDSIGGLDNMKELIAQVAWIWNNPKEAQELHLETLRRILLVGVPGSGKSAICEVTANALQLDLAKSGASQTMSKWVGESEANMRRVFQQIKVMAPIVMWIDEFGRDMSGSQSSSSVDGGTTDRVHGEFLTGIQELPQDVFLMGAANRIDLPPEMLRADRFDKIIFIGLPSIEERVEIFKIHLGEDFEAFDLEALAAATPFYTGAEIKALVREVRFRVGTTNKRMPTEKDILAYAPHMKGRIWKNHTQAIKDMYTKALEDWDWASSHQEKEAKNVLKGTSDTTTNFGMRTPHRGPVGGTPQLLQSGSAHGEL